MADDHLDESDHDFINPHKHEDYNLNSKIMLTAIISLSLVVVLVVILHLYARWLLLRRSRRRAALQQLGLAVTIPEPPKTGLDPTVISSLPLFPFRQNDSAADTSGQIECAICLSVLENDDMARLLPNCKHVFHIECIDKWLASRSTCPICRTEAEPWAQMSVPVVVVQVQPTAPPMERANSTLSTSVEGTSENGNQIHSKVIGGSTSMLSSFRKILNRERSSRRIAIEDPESQ